MTKHLSFCWENMSMGCVVKWKYTRFESIVATQRAGPVTAKEWPGSSIAELCHQHSFTMNFQLTLCHWPGNSMKETWKPEINRELFIARIMFCGAITIEKFNSENKLLRRKDAKLLKCFGSHNETVFYQSSCESRPPNPFISCVDHSASLKRPTEANDIRGQKYRIIIALLKNSVIFVKSN